MVIRFSGGSSSSGGATDHGALTGLSDDDHAQYILVAGTRAFSGDQSMGSNKLTTLSTAAPAAQEAISCRYIQSGTPAVAAANTWWLRTSDYQLFYSNGTYWVSQSDFLAYYNDVGAVSTASGTWMDANRMPTAAQWRGYTFPFSVILRRIYLTSETIPNTDSGIKLYKGSDASPFKTINWDGTNKYVESSYTTSIAAHNTIRVETFYGTGTQPENPCLVVCFRETAS